MTAPADPPPFPPFRVTGSERIYASRWCGLRRDRVVLPDGAEQDYHVVEIDDAVAVVPVRADGSIVLIGQYRYPHGKTHWEVPAGRVAPGEAPRAAAARELLEETGHAAARLVEIPGFYPANGITAHWAHAFVALDSRPVAAPRPEPSEQLLVRVFEPAEVRALLRDGRLQDAFTALTLFWWLEFGADVRAGLDARADQGSSA